MKKYDRSTKEWVSEDELKRRKTKRDRCKGGHSHDYIQTLPSFLAEATDKYTGNPEAYYAAEQEVEEAVNQIYRRLEDEHGIKARPSRYRAFSVREYTCAVCYKKKHQQV